MIKSNYKNLIYCIVFLAIGAIIGLFAAKTQVEEPKQIEKSIENEAVNSTDDDYDYIIKTYEGRLAVFVKNSKSPDMIFEVYTHQLPEYDRYQLEKGIKVKDYGNLVKLIEDYTT